MPAKTLITIVRRPRLLAWAAAGDSTLNWFVEAYLSWCRDQEQQSRQCLACPHEFVDAKAAVAWLFVEHGVRRQGAPRQVILVGICHECGAQTDAELLRIGLAGIRENWPGIFDGTIVVIDDGSGGNAN